MKPRKKRGRGRPLGSGVHDARLYIRMPAELHDAVRREATRDGIRPSVFMRCAIEHFLGIPSEQRRQLKLALAPPMSEERRADPAAVDRAA